MYRMAVCETKGFLTFLLLWLLSKNSMTGAEVAMALMKRKGTKPSPGTIYPALKYLKDKDLVEITEEKRYSLTGKGKKELQFHLKAFFKTFSDIDEMKSCCRN